VRRRTIARDRGFERLRLDSQIRAVGFYERLGYEVIDGEPFTDAGIPHRSMAKELELELEPDREP